MKLLDDGKIDGQALFSSPAKNERVRQPQYDREQAEQQQKRIRAENRFQPSIERSEKARERTGQKVSPEARIATKEEKLREKAENRMDRLLQQAASKRKQA